MTHFGGCSGVGRGSLARLVRINATIHAPSDSHSDHSTASRYILENRTDNHADNCPILTAIQTDHDDCQPDVASGHKQHHHLGYFRYELNDTDVDKHQLDNQVDARI